MAFGKMSTVTFLLFACALASLCHGRNKDCNKDTADMFAKMVDCITKKDPGDLFTILTVMNDRRAVENSGFMCSHPKLMSVAVECLLDYEKGCVPASESSQVEGLMPTQHTVQKGIQLLCKHRADFEHPCVKRKVTELGQWLTSMGHCIGEQLQSYPDLSGSAAGINMRKALCYMLKSEERCLDTNLRGCPSQVTSNMKEIIRAFFVSDDECPPMHPRSQALLFQLEGGY